jgi:hypothetical protein
MIGDIVKYEAGIPSFGSLHPRPLLLTLHSAQTCIIASDGHRSLMVRDYFETTSLAAP